MQYKFPYIEHIDQVRDIVRNNKAFLVSHKGQYTIIHYLYNSPEVFPDVTGTETAILRECRGIAFDGAGRIISRPFHKFFNYGERQTAIPDFLLEDLVIQDKLDGSMIRPLYLHNGNPLATKMGITEIALQAQDFIKDKPKYTRFIEACRDEKVTPIFEWCSRLNKVVLNYPEPQLTLLAMRHLETGEYYCPINSLAAIHDIPRCPYDTLGKTDFVKELQRIKDEKDKEGYVLVFKDGHRMKVKTDWYVTLHKAKDAVSREKHVIKMMLEGTIDDHKPLVDSVTQKAIAEFETQFWDGVQDIYDMLVSAFLNDDRLNKSTRKEFALSIQKNIQPKYHKYFYILYDNKDIMSDIRQDILKHCSTGPKLDHVRHLFGNAKYEEPLYEK